MVLPLQCGLLATLCKEFLNFLLSHCLSTWFAGLRSLLFTNHRPSDREPDNPGYVALKIYVTGYTRGNEAAIYERINSVAAKSNHIGHELIRKFLSSFELEGPHGKHTCIVQQALGITMDHLMPYLENKVLPLDLVKQFFRQLLLGLDFLHSQAGIIHTGSSYCPKMPDSAILTYALRFTA